MYITKRLDKRSGSTYVYECESQWDPKRKQPRQHATLIGKVDAATGEIVPTDGRGRRRRTKEEMEYAKRGPVPATSIQRLFYGATYLFDQICKTTGLTEDLKYCFPKTYTQILSIAYYLILEDRNPLCRFSKWAQLHKHPYGKDIPSQRSSDLFMSIREEDKMKFFRLQGKRRAEKEYWAYDATSISSTSECLRQVRYGKNKDSDPLPQVNLAFVFGEESGLPFYYRKYAGNIPDVKTLRQCMADLNVMGCDKVKLVMDRGFYSRENVNLLYKKHIKFVMGSNTTLSYAKEFIREIGNGKTHLESYDDNFEVYAFTKTIPWDYEQERPYKGDVLTDEKRMYLHVYYNFHDFFVLISNEIKDPLEALKIYRTRDMVEKCIWDVKERLNLKRTMVSSDSALEGKFFVEFVALIILSYIKKKMDAKNLYAKYRTLYAMLDMLDVIECFIVPGRAATPGEILKKQEQIYHDLDVAPPSNNICSDSDSP